MDKRETIQAAQAKLEEALALIRPLVTEDAWAMAYLIPALEDLIDSRNNPYNPSLATWLQNIDE